MSCRRRFRFCGLTALLTISFICGVVSAQQAPKPPEGWDKPAWAVPTFECLGLYYNSPAERGQCEVQYRKNTEQDWRKALPLVWCPFQNQYRGSVVNLTSNTDYVVRLDCAGQTVEFPAHTRNEQFPIGKTTATPAGLSDQAIHITESGTPDAWHLITPPAGTRSTIDVFNQKDNCIEVEANYVIIRGLDLKGAAKNAILIKRGVQNVVIEDCHMSGWGRVGGPRILGVTWGSDSGVASEPRAGQLVIQRNLIENPRSGSNDWETGHPEGPQAISFFTSAGGNIVRYNTIRSTEDHGYNDGFGGSSNFSFEGSPNRDSDIYCNIISNCWDDAIESEGANMNVRIFSNYITKTFQFVATASTSMGPIYIYRNVFGESRVSHQDNSGGGIVKTAGGSRIITVDGKDLPGDLGRRYIFHNTALQPNGAYSGFGGMVNGVSRNNIFRLRGQVYPDSGRRGGAPATGPAALVPANDFKSDITTSYLGAGIVKSMFLPNDGKLEWYLAPTMDRVNYGQAEFAHDGKTFRITDPMIPIPNAAIDTGERIPNFNDDFKGAGPDIGAFENGNPPLKFGRESAPGFARAPWEMYAQ